MLGYIRLGKVTLGWVIREGLDKLNFRVVEWVRWETWLANFLWLQSSDLENLFKNGGQI
jgi:hypothetical protein